MMSLICGIKKYANESIYKRNRLIDIENKPMVTQEEMGWNKLGV